jgi:hypothetical protein
MIVSIDVIFKFFNEIMEGKWGINREIGYPWLK